MVMTFGNEIRRKRSSLTSRLITLSKRMNGEGFVLLKDCRTPVDYYKKGKNWDSLVN